jgi:hypothetical protein
MPRRTNVFQEVVAIIHSHMAEGATVQESAMLVNRVTKRKREVDGVIRTNAATHDVVVSVEATKGGRMATVEWVERNIGKHQNLPTDKLVLVSQSGFRPQAREVAAAAGIATFTPEDLDEDDPALKVISELRSLWPKTIAFTPEGARIWVHRPDRGLGWFRPPLDLWLFLPDGTQFASLMEAVDAHITANMQKIAEQIELAEIAEDLDRFFLLGIGPPWTVAVDGEPQQLHLRWDETGELHPVDKLEVRGQAKIRVAEVTLTHHRLGEVVYAYGEAKVGDQKALVVLTEGEGQVSGKVTIKFRPDPEEQGDSDPLG